MKIIMTRPRLEIGGVSNMIHLLSRELTARDVDVCLGTAEVMRPADFAGLPIYTCHFFPSSITNLFLGTLQLVKIVQNQDIDLIHSHHRFTTIIGRLVQKITRIPVVSTIHEFKVNQSGTSNLWSGNVTVAPSESLRNHLETLYRIKNVEVIRNAILPPQLDRSAPSGAGFTIGFIGRLSHEKGADLFIQTAALALKHKSNLQFIILGDGPDRLQLQELATNLKIKSQVIFKGFSDSVAEEITRFDLIIIPSREESFSLVALEAMAAGKPILCSNVGGIPELVAHQSTGIIVNTLSAEEFSRELLELLENRDTLKTLGRNARERFTTLNDPGRMAEQYLEIYRRTIDA